MSSRWVDTPTHVDSPWSASFHAGIRSEFPGAEQSTYLDISARGLISERVRKSVADYLDRRLSGGQPKSELWEQVDRTRASAAALMGADAEEISIVKNVSEALNLFAGSLEWKSGDNVVVCSELEHPNNVFLWYNLRTRKGVEVREVPADGGRLPVERMAHAVDARTRLVTFPSVSFAPGFITDTGPLVEAARRHDALTLMDAAQSVGAIQTDVRALGIDALAVATQKCLLALYGYGFLYVRREVADRLTPGSVGRYGVDVGEGAHETALGDGALVFKPGALRFDLSNYNYLGAAATETALAHIRELGVPNIEAHVRALAARLAEGLLSLGLPVAGGAPGPHLSHIVAVGESGGGRHSTADDPRMNVLSRHLRNSGVVHSIRRGVLRFSVGVYNDAADIDRVVELAAAVPAT